MINTAKWKKFTPRLRLQERKLVLCRVAPKKEKGLPPAIAAGYLRRAGSDAYFVIPGVGGDVTHYCDCLNDDFVKMAKILLKEEDDD